MGTLLKGGLTVRGDSLYCPLALSLDTYWNCLTDCYHCPFRRLNRTWGDDLRPLDVDAARRRLDNATRLRNPRSPLSYALAQHKTLRIGSKTDPYQDAEREHRVTRTMIKHLIGLEWSFVIQTRHTDLLVRDADLIADAGPLATVMPVISPGGDRDWELFERGRTSRPADRLTLIRELQTRGINVGVNGEPFIPGYHTPEDFRRTLEQLKLYGVPSYNTYNLHMNDHVVKRLLGLGLDVDRIWVMNQDKNWKPILQELLAIAQAEGIRLGCPDFVNSGPEWREEANTCCGINVPNPCTFNTHTWKRRLQDGREKEPTLVCTWDGVGDYGEGADVMYGNTDKMYTMVDAGFKDAPRRRFHRGDCEPYGLGLA